MSLRKPVVLLIFALLLINCNSSNVKDADGKKITAKSTDKVIQPNFDSNKISPNHARITATVVSISDKRDEGDSPCAENACYANIRIDSMLGYGMAFPGTMNKGKIVEVKFRFTLSPNKEMFPNLEIELEKLTVNSQFTADIQGTDRFGGGINYTIAAYKIVK